MPGGPTNDRDAVVQTALDYIEGWYHADGVRMESALHANLAKRRVTPTGEVWEVTKEWMVEATADGRGAIEHPDRGRREVTILDMTDTIACVKLVSEKFVDYLHLAKSEDRWIIMNVLWDYVAAAPGGR